MGLDHWWDDDDRGNRTTLRKTCPSDSLSVTNPTGTVLGWSSDFHGEAGDQPPQPQHGPTKTCISWPAVVAENGPFEKRRHT
jgi:hypothetical protein